MGEIETIFGLLAVVYLAECCLVADRNAVVFSPAPFAWQRRKGIVVTLRSALFFLNPIPLLAAVSLSRPSPVSLSVNGVVLCNSLMHDRAHLRLPGENFIAYADIARLESGKDGRLYINDREFDCGDPAQAAQLASAIGRLAALRKTPLYSGVALDRVVEDELRSMFSQYLDAAAARQRQKNVFWRSLPAACLATFLGAYLFTAAPAVMILSTSRGLWLNMALALLVLHGLTVFCFWRAHRRLYPAAGEIRLKALLTMFFNPFAAMRCPVLLNRDALAAFHPMTVGLTQLKGRARRAFMHRAWAGLKYNTFPNYGDVQAHEQLTIHNRLLMSEAARQLPQAGVDAEDLLQQPARDSSAQSYCPICLIQYTADAGECLYCLGVPLHKP